MRSNFSYQTEHNHLGDTFTMFETITISYGLFKYKALEKDYHIISAVYVIHFFCMNREKCFPPLFFGEKDHSGPQGIIWRGFTFLLDIFSLKRQK